MNQQNQSVKTSRIKKITFIFYVNLEYNIRCVRTKPIH